ncbi:hypothetical protein F2Q69_00006254 [Brassica cretica]|uniref:Uncharacterized protein n=1 Tax=Brassica cretica TaxID=69181 RepID=A0A8S9NMN8_BRACR|nr:hypothetical protein F2Q69_00006254 [Brassica cretica]
MAISRVFFSDLKTGTCSLVVEARLLGYWEAWNVKRGGELMWVDMLLVDVNLKFCAGHSVLRTMSLEANLLFLFNFFPEFDSEDRKSPWMSLRMVELEKSNATGLNDQKGQPCSWIKLTEFNFCPQHQTFTVATIVSLQQDLMLIQPLFSSYFEHLFIDMKFTGGDGNLSEDPGASDATAAAEQPTSGGSNAKEQLVSAAGNTLFKARSSCSSDGTEDPNIYLNHL